MTVAAYNNGSSTSEATPVTSAVVTSYREAMAEFATMSALDVWYAQVSERELTHATDRAMSG